jgi:hypothetical protein
VQFGGDLGFAQAIAAVRRRPAAPGTTRPGRQCISAPSASPATVASPRLSWPGRTRSELDVMHLVKRCSAWTTGDALSVVECALRVADESYYKGDRP